MKHLILMLTILLSVSTTLISQSTPSKAGNINGKIVGDTTDLNNKKNGILKKEVNQDTNSLKSKRTFSSTVVNQHEEDLLNAKNDSLIKVKLVQLALNNPQIQIANASIRTAKSDIARAKSNWLSTLNASANINEFVVNGSPGALYYPKYNLGLSIPFDIAAKNKNLKKTAKENFIISTELKKDKEQLLKAQVLIAYENYKEKKEIFLIEKSFIEYKFSADEAAQQSFANGEIDMDEMNKTHQAYLLEKENLLTKQKDLNITIITLEQIIGVTLDVAISNKNTN